MAVIGDAYTACAPGVPCSRSSSSYNGLTRFKLTHHFAVGAKNKEPQRRPSDIWYTYNALSLHSPAHAKACSRADRVCINFVCARRMHAQRKTLKHTSFARFTNGWVWFDERQAQNQNDSIKLEVFSFESSKRHFLIKHFWACDVMVMTTLRTICFFRSNDRAFVHSIDTQS